MRVCMSVLFRCHMFNITGVIAIVWGHVNSVFSEVEDAVNRLVHPRVEMTNCVPGTRPAAEVSLAGPLGLLYAAAAGYSINYLIYSGINP